MRTSYLLKIVVVLLLIAAIVIAQQYAEYEDDNYEDTGYYEDDQENDQEYSTDDEYYTNEDSYESEDDAESLGLDSLVSAFQQLGPAVTAPAPAPVPAPAPAPATAAPTTTPTTPTTQPTTPTTVPPTNAMVQPAAQPAAGVASSQGEITGPLFCAPPQIMSQSVDPLTGKITNSCKDPPPIVTLTCRSEGDPHLTNFAGKQFDFYGEGDFLLAAAKDGTFAAHSRLAKWGSASVNVGLAILVNSRERMSYNAEDDSFYYGTKLINFPRTSDFTITFQYGGWFHYVDSKSFTITSASGVHTLATVVRTNSNPTNFPNGVVGYINIAIVAPSNAQITEGFCARNDITSRRLNQPVNAVTGLFNTAAQTVAESKDEIKWSSNEEKKKAEDLCVKHFPNVLSKSYHNCLADYLATRNEQQTDMIAQGSQAFLARKTTFESRWKTLPADPTKQVAPPGQEMSKFVPADPAPATPAPVTNTPPTQGVPIKTLI